MSDAWIPELLDGAALLDDLHAAITTYCVLPSPEHEHAVTLWVAATHCMPAFDYATRLVVRSAEKRSGKSRLLEVIDGTCHRPLRAVNATVSAIFRSLGGDHPPTLLLDEADTIFGSRKVAENNEELRGLINAGYQRGLPVLRTVGPQHTPMEFQTFTMAALAGIGRMPDTIEDRAVVVVMRRRKPSEPVQPFRLRRDKPRLEQLRAELAQWAKEKLDDLADADPDLPVEDRAADRWAPLVAVADSAGGAWPTRARQAAVRLTIDADEQDGETSLNVRLLADVRDVFKIQSTTFVKSSALCEHLHGVEDAPWKDFDLNPSKLGHRLRGYGIRTGHNTSRTERGYRIEDFHDAFDRYLPVDPSEGVQPVQQGADLQEHLDAFWGLDALKASSVSKASSQNRRSSGVGTPLDASGRPTGNETLLGTLTGLPDRCSSCGFHIATQGHRPDCQALNESEVPW